MAWNQIVGRNIQERLLDKLQNGALSLREGAVWKLKRRVLSAFGERRIGRDWRVCTDYGAAGLTR